MAAQPGDRRGQGVLVPAVRDPAGGVRRAMGLLVFTLSGDGVSEITRFDNTVLDSFGLPLTLA